MDAAYELVELCGWCDNSLEPQNFRIWWSYAGSNRRPFEYGGAMRDRTADLLRAKQALSQLSYSPNSLVFFTFGVFHNPKRKKSFEDKAKGSVA